MSETRLDRWGDIGALLVCLLVSVPVVLAQAAGSADAVLGPFWLWWLAYLSFLAVLVWLLRRDDDVPERWRPAAVALLATLATVAVVITVPLGITPILLIFSAGAAAIFSPRGAVAVIGLQTAALAGALLAAGAHPVEMGMSLGLYALLQAVVALGVVTELRRVATNQQLAAANVELQAARALLDEQSRADERLRIARELHDLVGHQLTALSLELEVAAHRSTPPADEHVARARRLAKDLLRDVRAAVGELRARPPELDAALRAIAAELPRPDVHVHVDPEVAVDEQHIRALVRCTQEVITNAIRHADADHVWIEVTQAPDGHVVFSARDDGGGSATLRLGHGLTGLKERVEELGGELSIEPSDGFHVQARVPAR